jgi:enoyl-CoA hydratase
MAERSASTRPTVRVHDDGRVRLVGIDRPRRRNAVDGPTAAALADAFAAFDADEDVDVAVLYGVGGTFCAGADLHAFSSGVDANVVRPDGPGPMGPTRMRLGKPVVAAVAGHAVAGGLELALWCDLRVVERSATFGVFCRRWGVPLIDGGTARLPALIGLSRALDLILTGRAVDADEAYAIGLANRVVEDGDAVAAAVRLAKIIAGFPQQALRGDRLAAIGGIGQPIDAAMADELRLGVVALEEARAGAGRFAAGAGRHGTFDPTET